MDFKTKGKIIIGLTGGLASGKTAAAGFFEDGGALVICSDTLAAKHFALNSDKIKKLFGTADKKEIAALVFKDARKRKQLEALLHPLITKEAAQIIKAAKNRVIVFDMPLLYEAGFGSSFDLTLCVYAAQTTRAARALKKGISAADFKNRNAAQLPLEAKAQMADIVLYNEGTHAALRAKILKLYNNLIKK